MLNRGKKSLTLDLKNEADRDKLDPLIKRADILIEQFRPGVMARLGLGLRRRARDQSATDLLLDQRLRSERATRRRSRARHQLHRQYRLARSAAGADCDRPVVPPMLVPTLPAAAFRR